MGTLDSLQSLRLELREKKREARVIVMRFSNLLDLELERFCNLIERSLYDSLMIFRPESFKKKDSQLESLRQDHAYSSSRTPSSLAIGSLP